MFRKLNSFGDPRVFDHPLNSDGDGHRGAGPGVGPGFLRGDPGHRGARRQERRGRHAEVGPGVHASSTTLAMSTTRLIPVAPGVCARYVNQGPWAYDTVQWPVISHGPFGALGSVQSDSNPLRRADRPSSAGHPAWELEVLRTRLALGRVVRRSASPSEGSDSMGRSSRSARWPSPIRWRTRQTASR